MDPIAAGPPTERNDEVSGFDLLVDFVLGDQSDRSAKNEGVGHKAIVKIDGSVGRGDPHPVAVIAHAGDHALDDAPGRQDPARYFARLKVLRSKSENIGVEHGLGAEAHA